MGVLSTSSSVRACFGGLTDMRIGIGGIYQETNTFATAWMGHTDIDDFRVDSADALVSTYGGTATEVGGMLAAALDAGIEAVPLVFAIANPGPIISRECYAGLALRLVEAVTDAAPLDAVALALHGAGTVEGIGSLELDLVQRVRAIVGPTPPIVATLDLHAMVPEAIFADVDLLLPCHHYPHTDIAERGREAIEQCVTLVKDLAPTRTAVVHVPLLVTAGLTAAGEPMREVLDACVDLESQAGYLDVSVQHGFPFSDVRDAGVHVVVTARDGMDPTDIAQRIADMVWQRRDLLVGRACSADEAVQRARDLARDAPPGRPVIVSDGGDNPGGAAPGDSTHLLRACLDAGSRDVLLAALTDPQAVEAARAAGVGVSINVSLGGRLGPLQGEPLQATAVVQALTDGVWTASIPMGRGASYDMGPTALLRIEGVDIVVCTKRTQVFDPAVLAIHGVAPSDYSIIVLKSSTHFRAGFEGLAHAIVTADAPGVTSLDLAAFPRVACDPPPYPLHPHADWKPAATLWRRR